MIGYLHNSYPLQDLVWEIFETRKPHVAQTTYLIKYSIFKSRVLQNNPDELASSYLKCILHMFYSSMLCCEWESHGPIAKLDIQGVLKVTPCLICFPSSFVTFVAFSTKEICIKRNAVKLFTMIPYLVRFVFCGNYH